jgi:hypothetical protein
MLCIYGNNLIKRRLNNKTLLQPSAFAFWYPVSNAQQYENEGLDGVYFLQTSSLAKASPYLETLEWIINGGNKMENPTEVTTENTVKSNKSDRGDWRDRFFEMDLLSPIYIFLFIVLFKDGVDGIDLHDAIIKFIANYNAS